jgi:hypothetical protein
MAMLTYGANMRIGSGRGGGLIVNRAAKQMIRSRYAGDRQVTTFRSARAVEDRLRRGRMARTILQPTFFAKVWPWGGRPREAAARARRSKSAQ